MQLDAGRQAAERLHVTRHRNRILYLARQDGVVSGVFDIHHRSHRLHFHGFADCAYTHFDVDRNGRVGRHVDAVALDRLEAGHGERQRVAAGPEIDDLVASLAVGGHRASLLDQHRAGRLDGDVGHDGAGSILDGSDDCALR